MIVISHGGNLLCDTPRTWTAATKAKVRRAATASRIPKPPSTPETIKPKWQNTAPVYKYDT